MLKTFTDTVNFSSNVYVVTQGNNTIIIDPGYYGAEVKDYLKGLNPTAILLTHGHYDHIMMVDEVKKDYPNIEVYIHKNDFKFLTTPQLNLSFGSSYPIKIKTDAISLEEGIYIIGNFNIEVINTKGHTKGSVLYYLKEYGILFTGDTLFVDSIGRTDFIEGSSEDMRESLEKIKLLNFDTDTIVCPGHGISMAYGEVKKINRYIM